jgi:hypothetical protein
MDFNSGDSSGREYLRDKIHGLVVNSKNKNIRFLHREINELRGVSNLEVSR